MTEPTPGTEPSREWFRDWFGEEYLELYPHRDEAEAARAVRLYLETVPPKAPVLDLACGGGRHLCELAEAGVEAIGLDLSRVLLAEARRAVPGVPLVRADMRWLPFRDEAFGGLTSFFTSFGYFPSVAEDRHVIQGIRRVLRRGGTFMLDFFNADRVRETLVPRDERCIGDRRVIQTREIVDDTVVKRIRVRDEGTAGGERQFEERVRLYGATELGEMLEAEGLRVDGRYGDYAGGQFDAAAERLILVGAAA
ncbi:MAG TPA: class I SAM-dependent methyltransferase [Gemmatimonadota bacterium]|nr:class I SAM-dependent methyltransferase [Gemmatimonadota bacterium]